VVALKKALVTVLLSTLLLWLAGCASQGFSYSQAMQYKINKWRPYADRHFKPCFLRAGAPYPPRQLALLVFKQSRTMQIYARSAGQWRFIRRVPILAASGGYGPKLHEGDRQVPEGIYHVTELNPRSHYDLSMRLSYPNEFDMTQARRDGRDLQTLGGDIYIHGSKSSVGCIAIGNHMIRQLFPLVWEVGQRNVIVIVAPNDFRRAAPVYGKVRPVWLKELYARITAALWQYPLADR